MTAHQSLADAAPISFWLDAPDLRSPPTAARAHECRSRRRGRRIHGLWTALLAKEDDPSRDVVLHRGTQCGLGGVRAQRRILRRVLTHGAERRGPLPETICPRSTGSAARTSTRSRRRSCGYGIDCDFDRTGEMSVAVEPHQVEWLRRGRRARTKALGHDGVLLDETRCAPRSTRRPTWPVPGTAATPRSSIRPGSRGDCVPRACRSACAIFEGTPVGRVA